MYIPVIRLRFIWQLFPINHQATLTMQILEKENMLRETSPATLSMLTYTMAKKRVAAKRIHLNNFSGTSLCAFHQKEPRTNNPSHGTRSRILSQHRRVSRQNLQYLRMQVNCSPGTSCLSSLEVSYFRKMLSSPLMPSNRVLPSPPDGSMGRAACANDSRVGFEFVLTYAFDSSSDEGEHLKTVECRKNGKH